MRSPEDEVEVERLFFRSLEFISHLLSNCQHKTRSRHAERHECLRGVLSEKAEKTASHTKLRDAVKKRGAVRNREQLARCNYARLFVHRLIPVFKADAN